jgi:hypothetical protein
MNAEEIKDLFALLGDIKDTLARVPSFDAGEEIDENDPEFFVTAGDRSPSRPFTDDEIKESYPAIWARRKLSEIINAKQP